MRSGNQALACLKRYSIAIIAGGFLLAASNAPAATLNIVGGQLLGASGVDVAGTLYDVEFVDGTCIELYGGCDDPSDFPIATESGAATAAQALLDQVFVNINLAGFGFFDDFAHLTNGCSEVLNNNQACIVNTPYAPLNPTIVHIFQTVNFPGPASDGVGGPTNTFSTTDTSAQNLHEVWAVWALPGGATVPEPGSGLLLAIGLCTLALRSRRASLRPTLREAVDRKFKLRFCKFLS